MGLSPILHVINGLNNVKQTLTNDNSPPRVWGSEVEGIDSYSGFSWKDSTGWPPNLRGGGLYSRWNWTGSSCLSFLIVLPRQDKQFPISQNVPVFQCLIIYLQQSLSPGESERFILCVLYPQKLVNKLKKRITATDEIHFQLISHVGICYHWFDQESEHSK